MPNAARHNMIHSQLMPNRVTHSALLAAVDNTPREQFVPDHYAQTAYLDEDIPLGHGRFLLEPAVLGRMLQLGLDGHPANVLDLAPASGYSSALLAQLCKQVVVVEPSAHFAKEAASNLAALGLKNIEVFQGPAEAGMPDNAPYDLIFIGGNVGYIPPALVEQLALNGKLVCVQTLNGVGRVCMLERLPQTLAETIHFDANVPSLPGFSASTGFVF